jgi:hypothetical protein
MKLILSFTLVLVVSLAMQTSASGQVGFKVFVTDDDVTRELDLKATEGQNGQIDQVSGFAIKPESVVQINQNENLAIFTSTNEPDRVEKVKVTDQSGELIELTKVGGNEWSLQGLGNGVYLLDVIVNIPEGGKGAYETVLVILAPNEQVKDTTQVIKQVVNVDTQIIFKDKDKNKSKPDLRKICAFNPEDKRCTPDPKKGCPPGFGTNEAGQCFPLGPCPSGYHRANDDETGRCVPEKDLKQCEDGSWAHKTDLCPGDEELIPTPPVDSCGCPIGENCPDVVCDEPVAELDSICGGVPCTSTEKENTTTSDVIQSEPTPESQSPTPEPTPESPTEELTANCGGVPCTPTEKEDSTIELEEEPGSSAPGSNQEPLQPSP